MDKDALADFANAVAERTARQPLFLHFDPIGLIRLGSTNQARIDEFSWFLETVASAGGTLLVPAYSYSYTKGEEFDVLDTPVDLGGASAELIRQLHPHRRTTDALFSYLVFGDGVSEGHFDVRDISTFGPGGLIDDVYQRDGYLGAVGGKLHLSTELHYIEQQLGVPYRFNKDFSGTIIDADGVSHEQVITYYCRKLEYDFMPEFTRLCTDLRSEGVSERWSAGDFFEIEVVSFRKVATFIEQKIGEDPWYLGVRGDQE